MARVLASILAIAVLSLSAETARADCLDAAPRGAPTGGPSDAAIDEPSDEPSAEEVSRRLAWIEARIAGGEDDVRRWFSVFVALQSLLIGVNLTLIFVPGDDAAWIDPLVSLIGSTAGLATLFVFFPPALGAGDALRALPRTTPGERLVALRAAEDRLRRSAEAARDVASDVSAITSVLYTEAASLTLLFLGQVAPAFLQAGGGIVVGLGRMLSHPTALAHAWSEYRARHSDAGCEPAPTATGAVVRAGITPSLLGPTGGGLALTLAF